MNICGAGGDWQNGKRHPRQIIHDQNSGEDWQEMLSWGRSTNEQLKKTKFDNAGVLRGIYFIDLEDKEFKETFKNARKKLEPPMAPAMPCKTSKKSKHGETRGKTNDFKSQFASILEASESKRLRMEESLSKYHEDHIAGKGYNSLQHYNLVHYFIPMLQAMKIPAAKAAVDNEWEKLEKFSSWNLVGDMFCPECWDAACVRQGESPSPWPWPQAASTF